MKLFPSIFRCAWQAQKKKQQQNKQWVATTTTRRVAKLSAICFCLLYISLIHFRGDNGDGASSEPLTSLPKLFTCVCPSVCASVYVYAWVSVYTTKQMPYNGCQAAATAAAAVDVCYKARTGASNKCVYAVRVHTHTQTHTRMYTLAHHILAYTRRHTLCSCFWYFYYWKPFFGVKMPTLKTARTISSVSKTCWIKSSIVSIATNTRNSLWGSYNVSV